MGLCPSIAGMSMSWGRSKLCPGLCSHFSRPEENSKKITCWSENHGWETGTRGPGSPLAPAGGSPGLSSAGWCSPSSCPLLPYVLRHFACGCLSVFLHSRTLSSISRPRALLQPRSAQSRIQIFWASTIWKKAPVLPAALYRLEWKKKKNKNPIELGKCCRAAPAGRCQRPRPLSPRAGEQPQPQSRSAAAQPRQSLQKK